MSSPVAGTKADMQHFPQRLQVMVDVSLSCRFSMFYMHQKGYEAFTK
jgi:hypothetical protein